MVYDLLLLIALTVLHYENGTIVPVNEQTEFVVDKLLYWISLAITLSAAIGIGFQAFRWLRKKITEDRAKDEKKIEHVIDEQTKEIHRFVANIVDDAKERRNKDEYMLTELIKRVDNIEKQQQMQLQVVMQNQQTITEFIASQKRGGAGPGRPIKSKLEYENK